MQRRRLRSKPLVLRDTNVQRDTNIQQLLAAYDTMDFTLCGWQTVTEEAVLTERHIQTAKRRRNSELVKRQTKSECRNTIQSQNIKPTKSAIRHTVFDYHELPIIGSEWNPVSGRVKTRPSSRPCSRLKILKTEDKCLSQVIRNLLASSSVKGSKNRQISIKMKL